MQTWENEFTGARVEAEEMPGPGWHLVPDPDVILNLAERSASGTVKIVELLHATLVMAREDLENTTTVSSVEAIAIRTRMGQARISLLKEILRRIGELC